jgi:glucokinase
VSVSVIGLDLGGTKVALAVKEGQQLGDSHLKPTDLSDGERLVDQIVEMIREARPDQLDAVGIGVPSVVEWESGTVVSSVNVPLADVPLRRVLGDRLGVPVFVENDATVAALAEAHDEDMNLVAHNLVMLTIGTGVGGGIILGGRIYRGATGGAGELGHTIIGLDPHRPSSERADFPQPGSLETLASGVALDRLAQDAAERHPDSELAKAGKDGEPPRGAEAVQAAEDGDPIAREIVEIWAGRVGIGIANVINTFDPEEVVIGGGAAQAGELLLEPARRTALAHVLPGLGRGTTIRLARHGVRAGVLGAALLAEHELHSPSSGGLGAPVVESTTEVT